MMTVREQVSTESARKTSRQPTQWLARESGVVASRPPMPPAMKNRVQSREKVSGANQRLNRVKEEDMTPAMPRPLSRRPATAMGRLWAVAKRKPPRAATKNWQLSRRRGPKRVERIPEKTWVRA